MNRLHLSVVSENGDPASNAALYNPRRNEFIWTANFAAFRVVPLLWWDDASYIRYQCDDRDGR